MAPKNEAQDVNAVVTKPFSKMNRQEKLIHIGKVFLCIISFGFVFPNIGSD